MAPLLPNARKHNLRRLAQEIHSATACLSASRAAICKQVGLNEPAGSAFYRTKTTAGFCRCRSPRAAKAS